MDSKATWTDADRKQLISTGAQITSLRAELKALEGVFLSLVNKKRQFDIENTPVTKVSSHKPRKPGQKSANLEMLKVAIAALKLDPALETAILAVLK